MDSRPVLPDRPVERALALFTGKWRLFVLFRLGQKPMRSDALQRSLPPITQCLTATLRGLQALGAWRLATAGEPVETGT